MAISSSCPDSSESLLARCAARPLMLSALHAHGIEIQEDAGALASLCRACGLEPNVLLAEVDAAEHRLTEPWRAQPLPALIEHVLLAYHQPFAAELLVSKRTRDDLATVSAFSIDELAWSALVRQRLSLIHI